MIYFACYILFMLVIFAGAKITELRTLLSNQKVEYENKLSIQKIVLNAEKNGAIEKLRKEMEFIATQEIMTYQKWIQAQHEIEALELDYLYLAAEFPDDD